MAYIQRLKSQNIVHLLQNRESGYTCAGSQLNRIPRMAYERRFYKSITPCLTIDSVAIPPMYLCKFTPDGSKLLAFSRNQRSLYIYPYRGLSSAAVGELIRESEVGTGEWFKRDESNVLSSTIFERLFATKEAKKLRLCYGFSGRHYLHREFNVFLENGRYVLLAAVSVTRSTMPTEGHVLYPDQLELFPFSYVFYLVDLEHGVVSHRLFLPHDSIVLSHNYGISVFGSKIAIMSRLYQCIYVFEMLEGKLYKRETIGPRPREFIEAASSNVGNLDATTVLPITHIKQRVLSFLYRQINLDSDGAREKLQEYYKNFEFIEHMIMERMQWINTDFLLLRYEERPKDGEVFPLPPPVPRRLYVFYTICDEKVVRVYPGSSGDLLQIIMQFYDEMSKERSLQTGDAPTLPLHFFFMHNLVNAIPHLRHGATRFNTAIPVGTQCLSPSPYLQFNDFTYNLIYMSPLERPNACSAEPLVFKDRETQIVKFRLFAKARTHISPMAPLEVSYFIWHPYEPLVFSILNFMDTYAYNVHLYHHGTIVEQPSSEE